MARLAGFLVFAFLFTPLAASGQDAGRGEEIFDKKCQACHRRTDEVKTGPGLAGSTKRHSEEWLHKWLASPKAVIESGDQEALALVKKFKVKMPIIDLMQDEKNRNDMIAFLKTLE
jgi:cytochrome c2